MIRVNPRLRQVLRWFFIAAFCGLAGCLVVPMLVQVGNQPDTHWAVKVAMVAWMSTLGCFPLILAHAIYRRNYSLVWNLFSAVCAIVVLSLLILLPGKLGLYDYLKSENQWAMMTGLPVAILFLVGPFYAARAVFNFMMRFQDRYDVH